MAFISALVADSVCSHYLLPMLAMPAVLLLLHADIQLRFITRHSCLLKFKSLCILEQQPGLSCSLSLRSRPTYHGLCQAQNGIFHTPGTAAPMPPFLLSFSSSPPLVLIFSDLSLSSIFV